MQKSEEWVRRRTFIKPTTCFECFRRNSKIFSYEELARIGEPKLHEKCGCRLEQLLAIVAGCVTEPTADVLQNQQESATMEEKANKESVDNGDSGEYDLSGENIGKDDGEKRNSREGDSERNIASSTDSKGKSGEIRTLDSGENDNKISDYEKGVVKKVYHGSAYKFEHFEKSYVDVGIHFGTKEQAVQRVGIDGILKECDLMLENPLECKDVFGERTPDEYVNDIIENSKLSENEKSELKERYTTYCKNAVCLEMVDSLESKVILWKK